MFKKVALLKHQVPFPIINLWRPAFRSKLIMVIVLMANFGKL